MFLRLALFPTARTGSTVARSTQAPRSTPQLTLGPPRRPSTRRRLIATERGLPPRMTTHRLLRTRRGTLLRSTTRRPRPWYTRRRPHGPITLHRLPPTHITSPRHTLGATTRLGLLRTHTTSRPRLGPRTLRRLLLTHGTRPLGGTNTLRRIPRIHTTSLRHILRPTLPHRLPRTHIKRPLNGTSTRRRLPRTPITNHPPNGLNILPQPPHTRSTRHPPMPGLTIHR